MLHFVPFGCIKSHRNFFATNAPNPPHWTLNSCFVAFRTIWVHLGPLSCLTKLGAKHSELVQKFVTRSASNHFAMNAPDPPHWTLNSCFGVFRTILVYLGPFGCLTNLRAKRSRVGIFHNERTRSTPLDPKLMFCCISYHLDALSRIGIFCNERTRSTPLDPKLLFWCVLYHLGAFGTVWLPYETWCKMGRTSAKLRATNHLGIFDNERTRSTPLDPKLMFCCVSYHLGGFATVKLPYETRSKTFGTSAKVRATKCVDVFRDERT